MSKLSETIVSNFKKSIEEQENPKNRIVTDVTFASNSKYNTTVVAVTSNCDGWCEREKILFTTSTEFTDEDKKCMIGHTEYDIYKKYYGDDFEELIRSLNILYSSDKYSTSKDEDGCIYFDTNLDSNNLAVHCENMCCGELILNDGSCNWYNIKKLREKGFDVFAGDRDSFGWLTGCVQKKGDKRILVYG